SLGSCSQDNRVPRTGRSGTWHPDARARRAVAIEQRIPVKTRIPRRFIGIGRGRDTPRLLQFAQGDGGSHSTDGMMRRAVVSTAVTPACLAPWPAFVPFLTRIRKSGLAAFWIPG